MGILLKFVLVNIPTGWYVSHATQDVDRPVRAQE